ncbi:MAG TPA: hypothetical protein DEB40_13470 [Elusimicrobia bacterium]|nr:hypothetical protein [Elusimicrobiota bacterium]HBT62743.1 hypothetical protein [Elusimicrobiota bacterium]
MGLKKRAGTALVHVLMTALVVSIIAAGMMQMLLLRSRVIARSVEGLQARKEAEKEMYHVVAAWNAANGGAGATCGPIPGYTIISGSPGTCNCKYLSVYHSTVTVTPRGAECRIQTW